MNIYHITSRRAWTEAAGLGAYTAPSLSTDGFVHCSSTEQVLPVARQFHNGQDGLVLLVIDTNRLAAGVRWERSIPPPGIAADTVFPHVYGAIPLESIVDVLDFEPDSRGEFHLPPLPSENGTAPRA